MEEWKEIPGFSSRYGKYYIRKDGTAKNGKGWPLLVRPHYKGYKMIRMKKDNVLKATNVMIHRAVCLAWLPNPDNKAQINHKNGIKTDNHVENLEWCTNSENQRHAISTGLKKSQINKYRSLGKDQVLEIMGAKINRNGRGNITRKMLADRLGCTVSMVKSVRSGKYYKDML